MTESLLVHPLAKDSRPSWLNRGFCRLQTYTFEAKNMDVISLYASIVEFPSNLNLSEWLGPSACDCRCSMEFCSIIVRCIRNDINEIYISFNTNIVSKVILKNDKNPKSFEECVIKSRWERKWKYEKFVGCLESLTSNECFHGALLRHKYKVVVLWHTPLRYCVCVVSHCSCCFEERKQQ